jgi:UDP-glucuronate 4-epimerase
MKILVTGGAGFIGSHISERLARADHSVAILDNFNDFYDPAIKRRHASMLADLGVEIIECDLRDREGLEAIMEATAFDRVVHLAARAGVRPSIEDPVLYEEVNCLGTAHLFEACRLSGNSNIVFASSSSVYGNNVKVPFAETDPVDHPISPYAATKKAGELLAHTYAHLHGFNITCLRFFTVYGPRQRPEMAIHKFIEQMLRGETIQQFGDGSSARDYTYVDDITDGILASMETLDGFQILNLGNSQPVALSELIERIANTLGVTPAVEILPHQPGDVTTTWADLTRAREALNYAPQIGLEEGLRRTVEWIRNKSD